MIAKMIAKMIGGHKEGKGETRSFRLPFKLKSWVNRLALECNMADQTFVYQSNTLRECPKLCASKEAKKLPEKREIESFKKKALFFSSLFGLPVQSLNFKPHESGTKCLVQTEKEESFFSLKWDQGCD